MGRTWCLALLALLLSGCSSRCGSDEAVPSVALDAGASDVRKAGTAPVRPMTADGSPPSAYSDANLFASEDTQAGVDADQQPPVFSFPGAWRIIPGAPNGCETRIALQPASSIPPFDWRPCASGRAGCEMFTADWNAGATGPTLDVNERREAVFLNGEPHFKFIRRYRQENRQIRYVVALQPLYGPTAFAASFEAYYADICTGSTGFGPDGAAILNLHINKQGKEHRWLSTSTWNAPAELSVLDMTKVDFGGTDSVLLPAHERVFVTVDRDAYLTTLVLDPKTSELHEAMAREYEFYIVMPKVVRDGVLVFGHPPRSGIYVLRSNGSATRVVRPAVNQAILTFDVDHGRGDTVVWAEGEPRDEDFTYRNHVLWTSPYASNEEQSQHRKVCALPEDAISYGAGVVANLGVVLFRVNDQSGLLVRLSDGRAWNIPGEPGRRFVYPLWVDDKSVWFVTTTGTDKYSPSDGLIRIDRATLGEPTIPNGL